MRTSLDLPNQVTSPSPSEGGGQDAVCKVSEGMVNTKTLGEKVLHPAFGGDGGGQNEQDTLIAQNLSESEKQERQRPGYITANLHNYRYIKEIRDGLKENQTEAEKVLWEYLRNKKTGHKIRRQHVIDNFITDFVCLPKKLVIEIDGGIHLEQKEQDALRTLTLNEKGYKVIRFTNEEVIANPQLVAKQIKVLLDSRQTTV